MGRIEGNCRRGELRGVLVNAAMAWRQSMSILILDEDDFDFYWHQQCFYRRWRV
jgi:hypothetical protein